MPRNGLLFVHSSDELYGADRMLLEILAAVPPRLSSEVWLPTDLAHPVNRLCEEVEKAATPVRHLPLPILRRAHRTPRGLLVLALRAARLLRQLAARRPATVYCTTSAAMLCAPLARLARVPRVVGHVQEIWVDSDRSTLAPLARACHVLVCISEAVRDSLPAPLQARAVVVTNATPAPARVVALAGREGPLRFLVASRWNAWKGHATLLQAWDHLADPGQLTVLGGAPPSGEAVDVTRLVAGLRRPGSVTIAGEVRDLAPYLEEADVVVIPSDEPEPFGLVAIEAMSRGRPVIASAAGGLAEIVEDGRTGWLFPLRDAAALRGVIDALTRDDVIRAGARARAAYEEQYTSAAFGERWRRALSL